VSSSSIENSSTKEVPAYKRLQRELEFKARRVFIIPHKLNKPGQVVISSDGVQYQIQEDGSWKRIKPKQKGEGVKK